MHQNIVQEGINLDWLNNASTTTTSINNMVRVSYLEENRGDSIGINQCATICSKQIMNRLYPFLHTRIPVQRNILLPGRHWIWYSFRIKLKKIAAMMIMSGHIIEYHDFHCRKDDECILSQRHNSIKASSSEDDLDGSHLCFDEKHSLLIRSGTAEVGMNKRWKEHTQANM